MNLILMVGPAGAGKSTWLQSKEARTDFGIHPSHILSSDQIREDLCGNWLDQSKNQQVFKIIHDLATIRMKNGLQTVIDATHLRRKDRISVLETIAAPWLQISKKLYYIIINRPMKEKYQTGGWRLNLDIDLIFKHEMQFIQELPNILCGDNNRDVTVVDLRKHDTSSETARL